jgi:hypothetical protein
MDFEHRLSREAEQRDLKNCIAQLNSHILDPKDIDGLGKIVNIIGCLTNDPRGIDSQLGNMMKIIADKIQKLPSQEELIDNGWNDEDIDRLQFLSYNFNKILSDR